MVFTEQQFQAVWEKGKEVHGIDKNLWRKDQCDAWIDRSQYGDRKSIYGWEIDHITPVDRGGTDDIINLRPLQWENNASRSSDRLSCVVTSYRTENVKA